MSSNALQAVAATPAHSYSLLDSPMLQTPAALASECALAISFNGLNHAVMLSSPSDLEDFALGFSLSNGLISSIDDVYGIDVSGSGERYQVDLSISSRAFQALKRQRRQLAGSSGCGLCGVEALEQALPSLPLLAPAALPPGEHFTGLRERISTAQSLARDSGALHAALYLDSQGEIRLCREDVGRHNALDKLIGALYRQGLDPRQGCVLITSRCGLELIHKAVRARIGTLVSLSAPTTLSVDWARQHQLNLIHLPHHSAPRVYSHV